MTIEFEDGDSIQSFVAELEGWTVRLVWKRGRHVLPAPSLVVLSGQFIRDNIGVRLAAEDGSPTGEVFGIPVDTISRMVVV